MTSLLSALGQSNKRILELQNQNYFLKKEKKKKIEDLTENNKQKRKGKKVN